MKYEIKKIVPNFKFVARMFKFLNYFRKNINLKKNNQILQS
jgi:hypothetical protein